MSASLREVLGIVYCKTCGCDTMPSEHTGCCFFCDTLLVPKRSGRGRGRPFKARAEPRHSSVESLPPRLKTQR
jgi:hypothetical protein